MREYGIEVISWVIVGCILPRSEAKSPTESNAVSPESRGSVAAEGLVADGIDAWSAPWSFTAVQHRAKVVPDLQAIMSARKVRRYQHSICITSRCGEHQQHRARTTRGSRWVGNMHDIN